jgi:hypothetical protein
MVIITKEARPGMLHDIYTHETLVKAAVKRWEHELAIRRTLAELPRRPGIARRAARRGGRLLIRMGARLMAYGADRPSRVRDLRPYVAPTSFSQN